MVEIYQLPENGNNNGGFGNIPFSIPIDGFGGGGLFGNGGYGILHIYVLLPISKYDSFVCLNRFLQK